MNTIEGKAVRETAPEFGREGVSIMKNEWSSWGKDDIAGKPEGRVSGQRTRQMKSKRALRQRALFAAALCVVAFVSNPANAKRSVPGAVESVTVHGVTYSAPATAMGFVVAFDASSGRELWRQRIYRIHFNPSLERDVQDVFITSLTLRGGSLLIANEHGERYALDLSTRKVTRESDDHT